MIYVTGDMHGQHDLHKLSTRKFHSQKDMTKDDYVIIAGDAGIVWDNGGGQDRYIQKHLNEKKFTTLFVDGNHENHDALDSLPVSIWNGGKVHFINESIIHLMRGQIFKINGVKFFTFGGARSVDIEHRVEGRSWWASEMPSDEEFIEGLYNLKAHNYEVDYIITHDCSTVIFDEMVKRKIFLNFKKKSKLNEYFTELEQNVKFKNWWFGHYHDDVELNNKHTLLYQKLVRIV